MISPWRLIALFLAWFMTLVIAVGCLERFVRFFTLPWFKLMGPSDIIRPYAMVGSRISANSLFVPSIILMMYLLVGFFGLMISATSSSSHGGCRCLFNG
jgi:hypothetical protein